MTADWSWPGEGAPEPEIRVLDLDDVAAMLHAGQTHRHSPERTPEPSDYDLVAHLPWGHTTGQHVLDASPGSEAEAEIRKGIAGEVVELLDLDLSDEKRSDALAHLAINDPARAIAMLSALVTQTWRAAEANLGLMPGATIGALRESLEEAE